LRTVPNAARYVDLSQDVWKIDPYAFEPRKSDVDGISLFREDFTTREKLSRASKYPAGVHVVRIAAQQLFDLSVDIETKPIPDQPGHVVLPALRYVEKAQLSRDQRRARADLTQKLAYAASEADIYSPPGLPPPVLS
jgi:hypothetical protein